MKPTTAAALRQRVIREITVAPGWNKEDATALVDELILSLPYIDDKNALPALDVEALARAICASRPPDPGDRAWMHVDDECRSDAERIAAEYRAILAARQP